MNNLITTNKLSKKYRDTEALKNVDIHIPKGSIYGLVGNNGAGKTTFLRMLIGSYGDMQGKIYIDNLIIMFYLYCSIKNLRMKKK